MLIHTEPSPTPFPMTLAVEEIATKIQVKVSIWAKFAAPFFVLPLLGVQSSTPWSLTFPDTRNLRITWGLRGDSMRKRKTDGNRGRRPRL